MKFILNKNATTPPVEFETIMEFRNYCRANHIQYLFIKALPSMDNCKFLHYQIVTQTHVEETGDRKNEDHSSDLTKFME